MLDSAISRDNDEFVGNVSVVGMISDNAIVDIKLAISKSELPDKRITYWKYGANDITQLCTYILGVSSRDISKFHSG